MKVFLSIVGGILVLALLLAFSWGMGWFGVFLKNTVGVANTTADRNIFEKGKSYIQGMNSDLANYKYEFEKEKDPVAKKAIVNMVRDKFASFNIADIESVTLQIFLQNVMNGKYNNLEENK